MHSADYEHMLRALALAEQSRGETSPNPMVGCVLVRDKQVIGEGRTQPAGLDHAEIQAIKDCLSRGETPRGSTAYTTLEPCNHMGRTGPCTEALIQAKVSRVVVAMIDPNPKVQGAGIQRLRDAGIEVEVEELPEALRLNEAFSCYITKRRPFSIIKVAQTLDGKVADPNKKSQWITGAAARRRVHQLRAESDAILTGVGTILADNPSLTVREVSPKRRGGPLRVIVDSHLRTPKDAKLLHDGGPRTIIATLKEATAGFGDNAELWTLPEKKGRVDLSALYQRLTSRELTQVMVEAGGQLNGALVEEGLLDKLYLFIAPKLLLSGAALSSFDAAPRALSDAAQLRVDSIEQIGDDVLWIGYPR